MSESTPEFDDGPPLPEMCEALLQEDEIERLVEDLHECTRIISIQEKGGEQSYANQGPSLDAVKQRLFADRVQAVQIRYAYDSREWTDTLLRLPGGVRLVRCQHPNP